MDFQLLAIAAAIIIVVIILVSCFLTMGARERSFEDALAEQQGLNLLLSSGDAKKHQKETKKKKPTSTSVKHEPPKKEKVKSVDEQQTKAKNAAPTETAESRSEKVVTVEPEHHQNDHPDAAAAATDKKGGKNKHAKNKDKSSKKRTISGGSAGSSDVGSSQQQVVHEEVVPQDPIAADEPAAVVTVVQQDAQVPDDQKSTSSATEAKKAKKQKAKPKKSESEEKSIKSADISTTFVDDTKINSVLDKLKLPTLSEAQIDVVANFYSKPHLEWSTAHGKPDQLTILKKQIEEKDALVAQETQLVNAANQKLKELKIELTQEKQRLTTTERNFKEQVSAKMNENQTLTAKLREIQTQMSSKMQTYQQMETQLMQYRSAINQANPAQVQQLRDENNALKSRIGLLEQDAVAAQRLKQELHGREAQVHRLEQQRQEVEQRFIHLEQRALQDVNVNQQLVDLQAKLSKKEGECAQQLEDLNKLRQEWSLLEHNVNLLRQQLADRDAQVVQTLHYQQSAAIPDTSKQDMDHLRRELDEMRSAKEKYNQELGQVNKHMSEMEHQLTEMKKRAQDQDATHSKFLAQKDSELAKLNDELKHLKLENDSLSQQKSKNEDARYKELEHALNSKNKLEADVAQLKNDLDSMRHRVKEQEHVEEKLRVDLQESILAGKALEADMENLRIDLEQVDTKKSSSGVAELQQHVSLLESTMVGRDNTVTKLEDQLKDSEVRCEDYESQLNTLRKQVDELAHQNQIQIEENAKLADQMRIQQAVNGHSEVASVIIDPDVLKVNERSMAQLNKQLINKDGEITHLKEQLENLRQKNTELRDKKFKAVEAAQQMELNAKELVDKVEKKHRKEMEDTEKFMKETLVKLVPECHLSDKESFREWIHEYERVVRTVIVEKPVAVETMVVKHVSKSPDVSEFQHQIKTLTSDKDDLAQKLSKYQAVLTQTETLLRDLEQNAVSVEREWSQKCSRLERQLIEVQEHSSSSLHVQLKMSEDLREQLTKFTSMLEKEKHEREVLVKELTVKQSELERERTTGRDLSAQAVKLRGMLKTGQDALKQEEELVGQLKAQLKALQDERATGQNVEDEKGGRSIHDEMEELRKKLSQRESQLEKEMMINKQLNNKLASLGVTTPSFSS